MGITHFPKEEKKNFGVLFCDSPVLYMRHLGSQYDYYVNSHSVSCVKLSHVSFLLTIGFTFNVFLGKPFMFLFII
jgi:hypothetical protein